MSNAVEWIEDWPQALARARETGRPLFLWLYAHT